MHTFRVSCIRGTGADQIVLLRLPGSSLQQNRAMNQFAIIFEGRVHMGGRVIHIPRPTDTLSRQNMQHESVYYTVLGAGRDTNALPFTLKRSGKCVAFEIPTLVDTAMDSEARS